LRWFEGAKDERGHVGRARLVDAAQPLSQDAVTEPRRALAGGKPIFKP